MRHCMYWYGQIISHCFYARLSCVQLVYLRIIYVNKNTALCPVTDEQKFPLALTIFPCQGQGVLIYSKASRHSQLLFVHITAAKENLTNQVSEIRGYAWFWQPNCAAFKELVSHTHGTINGTKVKFARLLWASTDV